MAPRKRNMKTNCSNDSTPVKASTSRARKESPLVASLKEDAKKVESPELLSFSPAFKHTQCDVEWAWKSPIGRTNDRSDITSKKRSLSKTPISSIKRSLKANSPLNHFSLKRKLIKNEQMEIDDLSILTSQLQALAECHEDSLLCSESESTAVSSTRPTKSGPNETTAEPIESALSAMFEDDDSFDLVRCSQYIEEKLINNPEKVVFSPIQLNSPVRKNPRITEMSSPKLNVVRTINEATPKTSITATSKESLNIASRINSGKNIQHRYNSSFPFHSKRSLPLSKSVTSMNNNIPNKSGESKPRVHVTKSVVTAIGPEFNNKIPSSMPTINIKTNLPDNAEIEKTNKSDIDDDSFDAALLNFCEQNVDLMRERELTSPKIDPTNTNDEERSTSLKTKVSSPVGLPINPPTTSFTTLKNENKICASVKPAEESNSNFDAALLAFCDDNSGYFSQTTTELSRKDQPLALVPKLCSENESFKKGIKQVPLKTTAHIATLSYKNQSSKTMEGTPNNNLPNKCTASSIVSNRNKTLFCESSDESLLIEPSNFDAALLAFCDQNTALMSQSKPPISTIRSSSVNNTPDVKLAGQRDSGCRDITTSSGESKSTASLPVSSNSLDDDFMQPDLLNLLESIESTTTHRPPSPPPLQCTPEEIEKKRKQARLKLEQKKKVMMDGINRLPNPFSNRKIQR